MYQVIILYGDNEPWWFFDGWLDDIIEEYSFETFEEANTCYIDLFKNFEKDYELHKEKPDFLTAFWNEGEYKFCTDCDDDLQQYRGLMLLKNYHKVSEARKDKDEETYYSGKAKCCKRLSKGARSYAKK